MKNNIKLIVSDCDGTLLNEKKEIDTEITEVIHELKNQGIRFTIASGRGLCMLPSILKALPINAPYITDNGANIYESGQLLDTYTYSNSQLKYLTSLLYEHQIPFAAFTHKCAYEYSSSKFFEYARSIIIQTLPILPYTKDTDFDGYEGYKITLDATNKENIQELRKRAMKQCPDIAFEQSERMLFTITNKEANKGKALARLANRLQIPLDSIMAFGDNYNDVGMISKAGVGIAVANGQEEAKAVANDICGKSSDNGVSHYLKNYFNLK